MDNKKKIGLLGCLAAGIGCIIGSGIFGSLPTVVNSIGPGVIWALLGAAFVVILRSISRMYATAALPTSASQFMHATKLMHPSVGALISINAFLIPSMVALFGVLFSIYFQNLFPDIGISGTWISVIMLLVFTGIAWFGNHSTVTINNIMVAVLLVAIALYIFIGLPNIDTEKINFSKLLGSGMALSGIGAAVGILTSSLSGASAVAEIADDVQKPGRNVPIALGLCPLIVSVIYILMAIVTIGAGTVSPLDSLAQVAENFMGKGLLTFFIVGGPIAGILTSMIPVALSNVAVFEFSAKNKIYPELFAKKNKHGVSYFSLFLVSAISIGIVSTGATFGPIMTIFSFSNTVSEMPNMLMPIFAHKKYPNCCNKSTVRMPFRLIQVLSILTLLLCVYLCWEMAVTMEASVWALLLGIYVIGYVYFFLRVRYLKSKRNIDLIAELKQPFAPWEEKERALASAKGV